MDIVLQDHLASAPWLAEATRRLPGLQPLERLDDWLAPDAAFAGQMALRDKLVAERHDEVVAQEQGAEEAIGELLSLVLSQLHGRAAYRLEQDACVRPDGAVVPLDFERPMKTLARLVQQDLCILDKPQGGAEHVLTAAALCFPASWSLAEKIGRPLSTIHDPVGEYDERLAGRVQRVFDHLHVGRPVWRQNAMIYGDPALYQPRSVADPPRDEGGAGFLRSEKQVLLRMPRTGAIVFSIHTYVVRVEDLTQAQREGLSEVARAR